MSSNDSSNKDLYQFYINDNAKNKDEFNFKNNMIDTTKYNCITFIPKALLFQFMRLANGYFLICAIIQCIPQISPLGPASAVVPIVIVISVSLIREAIEDYQKCIGINENSSSKNENQLKKEIGHCLQLSNKLEVLLKEIFESFEDYGKNESS